MEALSAQAIDNETLPARLVGFAEKDCIAIVPFRREILGVDDQDFFPGPRRSHAVSRRPIDTAPEATRRLAKERRVVK